MSESKTSMFTEEKLAKINILEQFGFKAEDCVRSLETHNWNIDDAANALLGTVSLGTNHPPTGPQEQVPVVSTHVPVITESINMSSTYDEIRRAGGEEKIQEREAIKEGNMFCFTKIDSTGSIHDLRFGDVVHLTYNPSDGYDPLYPDGKVYIRLDPSNSVTRGDLYCIREDKLQVLPTAYPSQPNLLTCAGEIVNGQNASFLRIDFPSPMSRVYFKPPPTLQLPGKDEHGCCYLFINSPSPAITALSSNKIYISGSGALYIDLSLLSEPSDQWEKYGIFTKLPDKDVISIKKPAIPPQITEYVDLKTEEELFSDLQQAYEDLSPNHKNGESKCSAESIQITSEIETVDDFRSILSSRLKRINECAQSLLGLVPKSKIDRYVLSATRYVRLALKNALKRTPRLKRSRSAPG